MKYSQKNPCHECPFRKASIRGWLGEDTGSATELINKILGKHEIAPGLFVGCEPMDFDCHVDTKKWLEKHGLEEVPPDCADEIQHCVGALLMLDADCKLPHNREKCDAMSRAKATEPMLLSRDEFITHHTLKNEKQKSSRQKKHVRDLPVSSRQSVRESRRRSGRKRTVRR